MRLITLFRRAHRFIRRADGATMVEYTVMLAIVVAVLLSAIEILGPTLNDTYLDTSNAIEASSQLTD